MSDPVAEALRAAADKPPPSEWLRVYVVCDCTPEAMGGVKLLGKPKRAAREGRDA
jgi:hypothetical protein